MENNERKSKYSCIRCGKSIKDTTQHIVDACPSAIENIDYIKCKICNKKCAVLYVHCKLHGLSSEDYQKKYGPIMCEEALKRISDRNKKTQQKSNYRNRLKCENKFDELIAFNQAVSRKVSEVVLASNELREIRSLTLTKLNKTDKFRKKASETAIKTSARPEIIKSRVKQLIDWKIKNPEKIQEMLQNLHLFQTSRPEKCLYKILNKLFPDLNFKNNQQLFNNKFVFNKTLRKQIDIFSKDYKIIVEFDGMFHFKNISKWNQLERTKMKDKCLNELCNEYCIIRVSADQFSYRKLDFGFAQSCLDKISEILKNPEPGLHLIGAAYAKN